MTRVLVDASALIALSRIGELGVLREAFGRIHTTRLVLEEATPPSRPDSEATREAARDGWIVVLDGAPADLPPAFGLGRGEASLFGALAPGDALLIDDANARRLADSRGVPHFGLVGALIAAAEAGRIGRPRALDVLERLAASGFRMGVDLYLTARARLAKDA